MSEEILRSRVVIFAERTINEELSTCDGPVLYGIMPQGIVEL
ncbi:hypothetical protein [Anaplasma bovis]